MFKRKDPARRAIISEAKRRGMTIEELGATLSAQELSDLIENARPQLDLSPWGLAPRAALVDTQSSGIPAIDGAVEAAVGGDWKPAAELLTQSYGEWDYRAAAVVRFGATAADDDGWLTAWRAASPDDRHALVVDCAALTALAWQIRGGWLAAQTSSERLARFQQVLADAEPAAIRAAQAMPADPTPWYTLVTIACGRGYDHTQFERVWQSVIERSPLHRYAHESALQYWCDKWCGSHAQMFAFAEHAVALSPSLSVLMVQAAYEVKSDDPKVWQQSNVRDALDTLLHWLDTEGAHSVNVRNDLGWAAMALVESERGAEAIPIFQQLGTDAGGAPWRFSPSPARTFNEYRGRACGLT